MNPILVSGLINIETTLQVAAFPLTYVKMQQVVTNAFGKNGCHSHS